MAEMTQKILTSHPVSKSGMNNLIRRYRFERSHLLSLRALFRGEPRYLIQLGGPFVDSLSIYAFYLTAVSWRQVISWYRDVISLSIILEYARLLGTWNKISEIEFFAQNQLNTME